jgi:hypothetical protein
MRQNPLNSPTTPNARPMANPAETEMSGMTSFLSLAQQPLHKHSHLKIAK